MLPFYCCLTLFVSYGVVRGFHSIECLMQNESASSVIYEVNFEIAQQYATDYVDWLEVHLDEMVTELEGFLFYEMMDFDRVKEVNDIGVVRKSVRWTVQSMGLLQRYFDTLATKYRTAYPARFENTFSVWRRVIRSSPFGQSSNTEASCDEFVHSEPYSKEIPIIYCIPSSLAVHLRDGQLSDLNSVYHEIRKLEALMDGLQIDNDEYAIHNLLYHLNVNNHVFKYYPTGQNMHLLYSYFQDKLNAKYIINGIKQKYAAVFDEYNVSNYDDINIDLIRKISENHRINNHPFLDALSDGDISLNLYETFLENYYVNNRAFHLMVGGLPYITPLKWRNTVYKNCYDETGADKGADAAHPILFLNNFLNKTQVPAAVRPFKETLKLFNVKSFIAFHSKSYEFSFGAFAFLEATMPSQMMKILSGAKKLEYSDEETVFWRKHISVDKVHGNEWFDVLGKMLKDNKKNAGDIIYGGLLLLDARAGIYDKMYQLHLYNQ